MGPAMPSFRFRTIQVCPKDCPSARWQADRAGIPGVYLRPKEIHHERADCTGSAGLGSRHRRNGALFGPSPPRHASVGIRSGLKTSARPDGDLLGTAIKGRSAMLDMRRREFITLLGGAAAAWPLAARAQQPSKLPTIGFLGAYTASVQGQWTAAFVQRLRDLGWIDGRTVAIEYRWAEGRTELAAEIATEFVQLKVDVIVLSGNALAFAAKRVTTAIPIVFALAGDPVGTGLVASLARPGGNITGLSLQTVDLSGKRIELLREIIPNLRRLAILGNAGQSQRSDRRQRDEGRSSDAQPRFNCARNPASRRHCRCFRKD